MTLDRKAHQILVDALLEEAAEARQELYRRQAFGARRPWQRTSDFEPSGGSLTIAPLKACGLGGASLGILSGFVAGNFSGYYLGLSMVFLMSLAYYFSQMGLRRIGRTRFDGLSLSQATPTLADLMRPER